ncbi:MAG: TlpA family protein disulfide reductase [Actinomycetes bacterium]
MDACPRSGQPSATDDALPNLTLTCLGPGGPVRMSGLSGRPLIVNVWASWCAPCRTEMPWLQRLADSGAVDVLGVDAEDQSAAASGLLRDLGISYPSVFDPENRFAHDVGIITKPMSLLVAPNGDVEHVVPGPFESYEQLVQLVDEHLGVQVN